MTHNPSNLTDEQIGTADGWRLLDEDECGHYQEPLRCDCWIPNIPGNWMTSGWYPEPGSGPYRTKLSRAELRKARNLPDEPSAALSELAGEGQGRGEDDEVPAHRTSWVNCPVCDESDMRREEDEEGYPLIFCVNHNCGSNGGDNVSPKFIARFSAEATAAQSAEIARLNSDLARVRSLAAEDNTAEQRKRVEAETQRDELAATVKSQSAEIATLQKWTRNVERERDEAQRRQNGLFHAIIERMQPYFPPQSRDLDWDVLPSVIGGVRKERDALAAELESCRLAGMKRWQQEMGDGYHWTNEKADALAAELERAKEALRLVQHNLLNPMSHGQLSREVIDPILQPQPATPEKQ